MTSLDGLADKVASFWGDALEIWIAGGWAMVAIALIALSLFGLGMHVWLSIRARGFLAVPERVWRRWIDHPKERRGPIGGIIGLATGRESLAETVKYFQQVRSAETSAFERDLRVMKIFVSAAPLVGLLGTVTGMLTTFGALGTGSGGDQTLGMVAAGISEALITTETGLVIALPGLFFQYQLSRKVDHTQAFLAHLENVVIQTLYRQESARERTELRERARQQIAQRLRQAVS